MDATSRCQIRNILNDPQLLFVRVGHNVGEKDVRAKVGASHFDFKSHLCAATLKVDFKGSIDGKFEEEA